MASDLYTTFCAVPGNVRWSKMNRMSISNKLMPGKLSILKLSTNFYLQCSLESGKRSNAIKLLPEVITKVKCWDGKFTCYVTNEGGICFILHTVKDPNLQYFVNCLETLQNGGTPLSETGEIDEFQNNSTPIQTDKSDQSATVVIAKPSTPQSSKVQETKKSRLFTDTKNTESPTEKVMVQRSPQKSQDPLGTPKSKLSAALQRQRSNIRASVSETGKIAEVQNNSTPIKTEKSDQPTVVIAKPKSDQARVVIAKPRTPHTPKVQETKKSRLFTDTKNTESPTKKVMVHKSPQKSQNPLETPKSKLSTALQRQRSNVRTSVSHEKNRRNCIEIEDHCDKENNECPIGLQTPDKGQSVSSDSHRSLGMSRKTTTPLNKRPFREVPANCPMAKVSAFYGTQGSGDQNSKNKKQPAKRSKIHSFFSSYMEQASPTVLSNSLSPSEVTSKGFSNLGNTCYMNAILQSLLRLVPFAQELANHDILQHVKRSSVYRCMYNLHCCKDEVGSSNKKQSALKRFRNAMLSSEMTKKFSVHLQNDAHEFMNICLDQMKEEVQIALGGKDLKEKKDVQAKVCPIVRNFEGCLRKHIICTGCKDLAVKDELFNHLSLSIPVSSGPVPINFGFDTLLGTFFKEEKVERKCEKCECNIAIQSLQIQSLPRVMVLHILRNKYRKSDGTQEKNSDWIKVHRYIDIGMFCSSDVKDPIPFSLENIDSSSTNEDDETPSGDQDDFVTSKPRRRLDMSIAQESPFSSSNGRPSTGDRSPDWVNSRSYETPRISSDTSSYNSRRLYGMNDKEQLELATQESLRLKQLEDDNALAMYLFEMTADPNDQIVPSTNETMKDRGDRNGTTGETKDEKPPSTTEITVDSNGSDANDDDVPPATTGSARKRRSSSQSDGVKQCARETEKDIVVMEDLQETPTKRRKIDENKGSETKKNEDFTQFMLADEDNDLERALELSLKQSDERLQVEEAIKRSLQDDDINAELLNLPECVEEENPVLPTSEEKDIPSHKYKLASIVRHIGSCTSSGHYISDVADLKTAQWTRFNDLEVKKVTEFNVRYCKESDGYIYFYLHKSCVEEIRTKST